MCWQCLIPVNHQSCRFGWANTNKPRSKVPASLRRGLRQADQDRSSDSHLHETHHDWRQRPPPEANTGWTEESQRGEDAQLHAPFVHQNAVKVIGTEEAWGRLRAETKLKETFTEVHQGGCI